MDMQESPEISGDRSLALKIRETALEFANGIRKLDARQWRKIVLSLVGLVCVTIGITYVSRLVLIRINLPLEQYAGVCLLTVFLVFLVANLMLFVPLPIGMTVLITAALLWNPALVGLAAALGASLGELSGYFAGLLGRNVIMPESFLCSISDKFCNVRLGQYVQRYGPLAIGILAAQPVLPFDVGGIIAGTTKMRLPRFFVALLFGKIIKYVIVAYLAGLLTNIPFIK
jgi:uncharacterized membrane protein YdjX (TVP38/TMEM64 family)